MRVGASISLLLHLALVLLFVFGLPDFFAPDELVEAIPVQIVTNISDETTQTETPQPAPPAPEPPKPEPPKAPEPQPAPPPAPEPPTPEPPAPQPAPEPPPAPEPEPVPEPVIAPPEPEPLPEPEPEPVEEAKVEPPPPAPPQKPKPPQLAERPKEEPEPEPEPVSDIASVLKNVEQLKQKAPDAPEPAEEPAPQTASQAPLGSELSTSEMDAIRSQIEQCWIVDVGMQGIEEIVVALDVQFNPDGSVYRIDFADPLQIAADQRYRVLAERARAAVQECSPIRVSSNYSRWKNITFRFNPRGMLGL